MHNMWKRKSIVAGAAALGALVVAAWSVPSSQARADEGSNQILKDVAQISPENFKDAKFREVLTEYDFNSDGYLQDDEIEIMGVHVPHQLMPIKPGRNLAIIVEVAARNLSLKRAGYNAARELSSVFQDESNV